ILYRIGDETTGTYKLSKLESGAKVDVMGPLGNGFPVAEVTSTDKILIIGGGIGVPPLYELAKQLEKTGCQMTIL
ncbi:dihydroorotate dehydrogenase electron transfer subunit, partial [Citrobacter sp. TBCS-11]